MENKIEKPGETVLVLSGDALRDIYFLLNQNKNLFLVSEDLNTLHRLTGIAYRVQSELSPEEAAK